MSKSKSIKSSVSEKPYGRLAKNKNKSKPEFIIEPSPSNFKRLDSTSTVQTFYEEKRLACETRLFITGSSSKWISIGVSTKSFAIEVILSSLKGQNIVMDMDAFNVLIEQLKAALDQTVN